MIKAGQIGVDFAVAPAAYADMAKKGVMFSSRYCKGVGGASNQYAIKPGEIQAAGVQGIDFMANFELAESTPTLGAAVGRQQGLADKDFLNQRGYAANAGVCISWEPGNDKSKFNVVSEFIEAYQNAVGRPVGAYMALSALLEFRRRQLIDMTWLPMSSSASGYNWGNIPQTQYAANMLKVAQDNGINFVQNRNRLYNGGADENVCVSLPSIPWSHMQLLAPQPPKNTTPPPKGGTALASPIGMLPGQALVSNSGHYVAIFQGDGNFVVYNWPNSRADFSTGTNSKDAALLDIQNDGNVVIYDRNKKPLWSTGTAGKGPIFLQIQDDGNLVAYKQAKNALGSHDAVWTIHGGVVK